MATCGHCGRRLHIHYQGRNSTPGYHCAGKDLVNGRGVYCLNISGPAIEQAVANAFLEAVTPAAVGLDFELAVGLGVTVGFAVGAGPTGRLEAGPVLELGVTLSAGPLAGPGPGVTVTVGV